MLDEKSTRPLVISAIVASGCSFAESRRRLATGDITEVAEALRLWLLNLRALAIMLLFSESVMLNFEFILSKKIEI